MNKESQGIILVCFGGAILRVTLDGFYLNYVKEAMQPWLIVSAVILCLLGLWFLLDVLKELKTKNKSSEKKNRDSLDEHGHKHGGKVGWLMLVPALTIFLIAPPALGAYTAARSQTNAIPKTSVLPPLPAGDPAELSVSDYVYRAVWDYGGTLEGRTVQLIGFVTPNPEGGWWITRLSIACCAADAFASRIEVLNLPRDWQNPPADTWVSLIGSWVPGEVDSPFAIPLIEAEFIEQISAPENPYE
jgi:uncharacterized repeat protein (TIGR03943 family)